MKIVAFSDLHSHAFKNGVISEDGRNSRVSDAVKVIEQVYSYALQNDCDYVLFGGDLFDTRKRIDVDTYNRTHHAISVWSEKVTTYMIPGNHDQANKSGTIHSLSRFNNRGRCEVLDKPLWRDLGGGIGLFGVPYIDDGEVIAEHVREGVRNRPEYASKGAILLMHYGVLGAKVGPSDYVLPCELELHMLLPDNWDLILGGHYHIGQQLGSNFHYIGSGMQHRWDDAGFEKSFMVIDTDDWSISRIPTEAPKFLLVTGKTKDYEVSNCFVKVVRNYHIEDYKKEKLRKKLLDRGALSVIIEDIPEKKEQSEERITFSDDAGPFGKIEEYVNSDIVDKEDLDLSLLMSMGKEILQTAFEEAN